MKIIFKLIMWVSIGIGIFGVYDILTHEDITPLDNGNIEKSLRNSNDN